MRPVRRLLDIHAERPRDLLCDDRARLLGVELQGAADQLRRVDVAEHDIGVCDGRLAAALVVADRARRRAGAHRPDLQRAAAVDPQDRAAAGADLGKIDRRHFQRISGARQQPRAEHDTRADLVFGGARHLAILDQRGLGGRAAHIERNRLVDADPPGQRLHPDNPGGRPRLDNVHRRHRRRLGGREAAVRLH